MRVATPTQRRPHGFTLIEAMMTVAIVAILAAIAYPQYAEFVTRSRIIDGTTKLSNFRVQMEQYFMDNRTYLNGAACGIPNLVAGANDYFGIVCGPVTATTYVLTAQGVGPMAAFSYTVDQANNRATPTANPGWTHVGIQCWVTKRDGTC